MNQNRLLKEAQLIASKFKFWMVENKLDHLFGYVYESPDGRIKIPIDIIYNENFPNEPPEISFREDPSVIENFPTEIE
ncbi:MAG: hypothetical protein ACTSXF_13690, partial [Promethearchaeota archaeon]